MFDPTFSFTNVLPKAKPFSSNIVDKVSSVPIEIITYLSQLSKELENSSQEEIGNISTQAILELKTAYIKHLVGICGHYEGSRKLENFLSSSKIFVVKFGGLILDVLVEADIRSLVHDKIGSHVLQSFIIESRSLLKENGEDCSIVLKCIEYISSIFLPVNVSIGNSDELMENQYASHVLRSILVTLSGKPIYYEHVFSLHSTSVKSQPLEDMNVDYDSSVASFFKIFISNFLSSLSIYKLERFVEVSSSQYASPILQVQYLLS